MADALTRVQEGDDPTSPAFLATINGLIEAALRNQITVAPGSGLEMQRTSAGVALRSDGGAGSLGFWGKLTAQTSAKYTAVEQVRNGSGGWSDGPRTVTAIEVNGTTTIPVDGSKIARIYYAFESGEYLFQGDTCTASPTPAKPSMVIPPSTITGTGVLAVAAMSAAAGAQNTHNYQAGSPLPP